MLWSEHTSAAELTDRAATLYCLREGVGWRLPNRAELASMFIGDSEDERELKPELARRMPKRGKLWSGEDVSTERRGQKWVVNLSNGHVYNGHGGGAHARCVHGDPLVPEPTIIPSDPTYEASLGPPDATRTVTVFCQYGYPCSEARPVIEQLLADEVRIKWKQWVVRDRLEHYSLAACAATGQGKFAEMHQLLWDASTAKATPSDVRHLAEELGLDLVRFDTDMGDACTTALKANQAQAKALELAGTPSVVVRGVAFNPLSEQQELLRAVDELPR